MLDENDDAFDQDQPDPAEVSNRDGRGRFMKGRPSGNPRGAPPKSARTSNLFQRIDAMSASVLAYANKQIPRPDGTWTTPDELVNAAIAMKARNGDVAAQRLRKEMMTTAAASKAHIHEHMLMAAHMHKEKWGPRFAKAEREGKRLNILPHPDDVIINPDGTVDVVGPVSYDAQQAMLQVHRAAMTLVADAAHILWETMTDDERKRRSRKIHRELNKLNQALPPRLHQFWTVPPRKK